MKLKVILMIVVIMILSINIVVAQDLSELHNERDKLQEQIDESNEQIKDLQIELSENLEQINSLDLKISTYEEQIKSLEKKLKKVSVEIKNIKERLNSIEEVYRLQKNVFQDRVVALYEAGDIFYLDVLLNSNNISEFISNYFLIGEIIKYDNELLENIEGQKKKIEDINKKLVERQKSLKEMKDNREKTIVSLENSKIIRNTYIAKLTTDEKLMQEKIDKYKTELNSIDAQITLLTSLNIGEDYVGGEFVWPAPGYSTITSNFGMRFHPILKVNRLHTGTDVGMPTGSYIVASNEGIVIKSMYTTGYGNMVMIDHGGGITTLYAHGSEIVAKTRTNS